MDEVAFQDWPGPPVDLCENNPWMPAYGFQTPSALMDKEDFIGNPDAEYFLRGSSGQYMYLETIQEETSDDLRSESDVDSRNSPMGWLATDSEHGSVIFVDYLEDEGCDSEREIACPPKRRKQDIFLTIPDNVEESLSRSSSLLQFETLEKECQQEQHSPSIITPFSFDSLETRESRQDFTPRDFSSEYNGNIFRNFKNEINSIKSNSSRDSLLYNVSTRYSSSDSSDSDATIDNNNSRSCDNLKTWRSVDSLFLPSNNTTKKNSSENLSEDSGYGDQLHSTLNNHLKLGNSFLINLSSSVGKLEEVKKSENEKMINSLRRTGSKREKNSNAGFDAYDCVVVQNFTGNFGVSYQDLSIFHRYDPFSEPISTSSPLTDAFLRKKQACQQLNFNATGQIHAFNLDVNIDSENSYSKSSKFRDCNVSHAASVPNLLQSNERSSVDIQHSVLNVYSVPKDLNFIGAFNNVCTASVAEKNWNLVDLKLELSDQSVNLENSGDERLRSNGEQTMANYKREGSYSEAMSNRVDLSDDENSLVYNKKLPKSTIVDFDKRVLKAISEQSIQSLMSSATSLHSSQRHLDQSINYVEKPTLSSSVPIRKYQNKTVALSTPDLNRIEPAPKRERNSYFDDDRRKSNQEINSNEFDKAIVQEDKNRNILLDGNNEELGEIQFGRKGSIIKSSTSTSGMSDIDDKTLRHSVKSFTGSNGSKGVHFSPVVAEVNWRDDASTSTVTPDRDSLYSLESSSSESKSPKPKLVKPKPQYATVQKRRSVSQPDLSDSESKIYKREFIDSLNNLRNHDVSKSQPDVSKLRRRGSQLVKKDKDGCTIKAYVDTDGVQYQHTHLNINSLSQTSLTGSSSAINKPNSNIGVPNSGSKNSLTSKFPFYHTSNNSSRRGEDNNKQSCVNDQSGSGTMSDRSVDARSKRKNKSGLGGFLQRLASFRLGAKKGSEQKDKFKRKTHDNGTASVQSSVQRNLNLSKDSSPKPNYIFIPLKGPSPLDNNNTNSNSVSAKPPLPKQPPPRVVHASVKKTHAPVGGASDERRRRRTIDSMNGAVEIRDIGHHGHGNASMDGPMGLIETDLDTEVTVITNGANAKTRSLLNLGPEPRLQIPQNANGPHNTSGRPHKSMEFLLDKQNLKVVEPPENELQKTERVMSEHELRVQRSLQKLTVPEWYKNSQVPGQGFLLKKHQSRETRWTGTGSKTTSLSSLGSGTQSPLVLSPTPSNQPFVRWSTSKLNSTASSPCQSTRSSFNQGRQPNGSISPSSARSSFNYRQPYLGWRSQERLNRPRTPAERLASTLLSKQNQESTSLQQESPEIQTSIKEVTSAIVHYVSGLKPAVDGVDNQDNASQRSNSVSPRGSQKLCWLESSFVGTKPLDSPETPVTYSESPVPPQSLRLDLQNHSSNGEFLVT